MSTLTLSYAKQIREDLNNRINKLGEDDDAMPLVLETLDSFNLIEKVSLLRRLFEEKHANIHYRDAENHRTLLYYAIGELDEIGDGKACLEYLLGLGAEFDPDDIEFARHLNKDWAVEILERHRSQIRISSFFRQYVAAN